MVRAACLGLVLAAVLALSACAADQSMNGPASSGGLSGVLPDTPGAGLPSNVQAEETLDLGEAATALPSDSATTSAQLSSLRFRAGYIRVWGNASNYVTMAVLVFPTVPAASSFVGFERSNLGHAINTYVTSHASIPNSFVFVISSPTKQSASQQPVLCNGVWFPYQTYAFES